MTQAKGEEQGPAEQWLVAVLSLKAIFAPLFTPGQARPGQPGFHTHEGHSEQRGFFWDPKITHTCYQGSPARTEHPILNPTAHQPRASPPSCPLLSAPWCPSATAHSTEASHTHPPATHQHHHTPVQDASVVAKAAVRAEQRILQAVAPGRAGGSENSGRAQLPTPVFTLGSSPLPAPQPSPPTACGEPGRACPGHGGRSTAGPAGPSLAPQAPPAAAAHRAVERCWPTASHPARLGRAGWAAHPTYQGAGGTPPHTIPPHRPTQLRGRGVG